MRYLFAFILFLFINAPVVLAQRDQFGLKASLNASTLSSSLNSNPGFKIGPNVGVYYKAYLGKRFFFRPEIYYSSQGQNDDYSNKPEAEASLNYLNIPFLIEYGNKVSLLAGPQVGLLLSAHRPGTNTQYASDNLMPIMQDGDVSIVLGVSVKVNPTLNAGLRLNKGLSDIFISQSQPGLKVQNNVFHFYFGVLLKSESLKR